MTALFPSAASTHRLSFSVSSLPTYVRATALYDSLPCVSLSIRERYPRFPGLSKSLMSDNGLLCQSNSETLSLSHLIFPRSPASHEAATLLCRSSEPSRFRLSRGISPSSLRPRTDTNNSALSIISTVQYILSSVTSEPGAANVPTKLQVPWYCIKFSL